MKKIRFYQVFHKTSDPNAWTEQLIQGFWFKQHKEDFFVTLSKQGHLRIVNEDRRSLKIELLESFE